MLRGLARQEQGENARLAAETTRPAVVTGAVIGTGGLLALADLSSHNLIELCRAEVAPPGLPGAETSSCTGNVRAAHSSRRWRRRDGLRIGNRAQGRAQRGHRNRVLRPSRLIERSTQSQVQIRARLMHRSCIAHLASVPALVLGARSSRSLPAGSRPALD